MRHSLQAILDDYQSDIERATEISSARFKMALQERVNAWSQRFHRHKFKVWEGHGMISIDVSPPIRSNNSLEFLDPKLERGAISELAEQVREIVDTFNNSEFRVSLICETVESKES